MATTPAASRLLAALTIRSRGLADGVRLLPAAGDAEAGEDQGGESARRNRSMRRILSRPRVKDRPNAMDQSPADSARRSTGSSMSSSGRFLAAVVSGEAPAARRAIEDFDGELRRHTAWEEARVFEAPAGRKLVPGEAKAIASGSSESCEPSTSGSRALGDDRAGSFRARRSRRRPRARAATWPAGGTLTRAGRSGSLFGDRDPAPVLRLSRAVASDCADSPDADGPLARVRRARSGRFPATARAPAFRSRGNETRKLRSPRRGSAPASCPRRDRTSRRAPTRREPSRCRASRLHPSSPRR